MRSRLSGGDADKPILLYVGRVSPEKRIDQLKVVIDSNPECRLAIIGEGPQLEQLKHLFAGTPTVLMGSLRNEVLAEAYASASVFVYPGSKETFGNVVLEAMASGLPVVAPNSGGLLDFCHHGENALLFDADDFVRAGELARQITRDPELII